MIQAKDIKALEDFTSSNPSKLLFILFHGYGADAYDLQGLKDVIVPPHPDTHWVFPQGVLSVPIGPGWMGRAWWNIDMAAIERAMQTGEERDMAQSKPETLDELQNALAQFIEKKGYSWDHVILGGFSQGAMLSTHLFLNAPQLPKALVLLSGALINKSEWQSKEIAKGAKVFISHGTGDPILNIKNADRLESLFKAKGSEIQKVIFNGQHEIPPLVIEKLNAWLKTLN